MAEKKTEIDYLQDLEKAHKKYLDLIKSQEALSKECKNLTDELRSVHREYMKEPELRTAAIKETKAKYSKQVQEEYEASRKYTKAVNDSYKELKKFENILKNNDLKKLFTHLINNVNKDMSDKIQSALDKYKAMNAPKQSLTAVIKEVKQASKPVEKLEKAVEKLEKTVEKVSSSESGSTKSITPKVSKTQLMREKTLNDFFNGATDTPGVSDFLADPKAARAAVVEAVRGSKKRTPETFMAEILKSFNDLSNSGAIQYKKGSTQEEVQKFVTKGFFDVSAKQEKEASKTQRQESTVNPKQPAQPEKIDISEEQRIKVAKKAEAKAVEKVVVEKERSIDFETKANESLNSFNSILSNLTARSKRLTDTVNRADIILSGAVYGLTAIRKSIEKSKLVERIFGLSKVLDKTADKLSRVPKQAKVKGTLGSPVDTAMDAVEKEVPEIKRPKSSHAVQESRNRDRANQKGFIALLIPALAKLLKKTPIWDAIKLLLLKFGAKHPLLTAGALMAGPALMAGGIGMKLLGGLGKGAVGGKVVEKISNIPRAASVLGSKYFSRIGSVISSAGSKVHGVFSDLKALYKARMDLAKATRVSGRLEELYGAAKYNANFAEQALHRARNAKGPKSRLAAAKLQNREAQLTLSNVNQQIRTVGRIQDNLTARLVKTQVALTEKYLSGIQKVFGRVRDGFRSSIRSIRNFFDRMSKGWKSFTASTKEFFNTVKSAGFKGNMKAVGQAFGKGTLNVTKGLWNFTKPSTVLKALGKFGKGAKFLGPLGIGISALAEVPDLFNAATSGKPGALKKQLAKSGGGVGGAIVGAGIGATLGTALAPALGPLGPVLGGILGSIIGDIMGRVVGPALMDGFGFFTKNIGKDFRGMWDSLKTTMHGLGNAIGPIARLLGRLLVPTFKVLGAVLGGLFKTVCWGLNVILKAISWVANTIGNIVTGIESAFKNAWNSMQSSKNPFVKLIVKGLKGLFGTSGDKDSNTNGNTAGNAVNTAASTGGGSSAPAKQGNTNFDKLVQEEREKMKKEGTDKNLKDHDKVATLHAIQRLDKHTTNGIANTVDMRDLGLYGNVAATNSRPYIPINHALRMKMLDDKFKEWGVAVDYTSNMGGHDSNKTGGHYVGNKVDVVTKDKYGRARQLSKEQENWLRANGYIGNGAVGWHDAGSGYHYDLRVAPGARTNVAGASTAAGTTTSTAVLQQTDDGVREALLAFTAANKKDKEGKRTRDLIFQATDVTGSLGCWGITQVNNSGQMRH